MPLGFTVEPVEGADGRWRFRASYFELADCTAESDFVTEAMDQLDRRRAAITLDLLSRDEEPPRPRPPVAYWIHQARETIESLTFSGGA